MPSSPAGPASHRISSTSRLCTPPPKSIASPAKPPAVMRCTVMSRMGGLLGSPVTSTQLCAQIHIDYRACSWDALGHVCGSSAGPRTLVKVDGGAVLAKAGSFFVRLEGRRAPKMKVSERHILNAVGRLQTQEQAKKTVRSGNPPSRMPQHSVLEYGVSE